MKGQSVTEDEKGFHDLMCREVGCICCFIDSQRTVRNSLCSPHRIYGDSNAFANWYVIGLCKFHADDHGIQGFVAVRPDKARFEARYGDQMDLLRDCIQQLVDRGHQLPKEALAIL